MKKIYSFRLDIELLERAQKVAIFRKTTVSNLITQSLLENIEKEESLQNQRIWDFRYNQTRPYKHPTPSLKKMIRQKYNLICQKCGITETEWQQQNSSWVNSPNYKLHVAHIEAQANFLNPDMANIENNFTLLCPKCHREEHKSQKEYLHYNKF